MDPQNPLGKEVNKRTTILLQIEWITHYNSEFFFCNTDAKAMMALKFES